MAKLPADKFMEFPMKNFVKLFGIIALMTVIGFTMACDIATE
jgi:hypothetical protein